MADVTLKVKLQHIKENKLDTKRIQRFVKDINDQISNYRLLAIKKKGTYLGRVCSKDADVLQTMLNDALGIKNEKTN